MKNVLKSATDKIKQNIIPLLEEELNDWPPTCTSFLFQVERPIIKTFEDSDN